MKKYQRKFPKIKEDMYDIKKSELSLAEEIENKKVVELLSVLKNEKFGNDDQRKRMIDILTSLFTVKDKDARKIFKRVGEFFTDLGEEMLDSPKDISDEKIKETVAKLNNENVQLYKSKFDE